MLVHPDRSYLMDSETETGEDVLALIQLRPEDEMTDLLCSAVNFAGWLET